KDETENVLLALDSAGDLTIGGSASPTFQATGGQFTLSGKTLALTTTSLSNGDITISPDGSGIIDLQKGIQNTTNYSNLSNTPGAVEVDDVFAIFSTSSSHSALTIKQNGTSDIVSGYQNDVAKFRVDGIGNAFFAGNLVVDGNTIGTNATSFAIANNNVLNLSIGNNARALSLGGSSGITSINNSLSVSGTSTLNGAVTTSGLLTANAGITIPSGQSITLAGMKPGAIPFINSSNKLTQSTNFSWSETKQAANIVGSLCLRATQGACAGSAPGTIYAANATVQAADLAENYISSQQLEPGDLVIPESLSNSLAIVKATTAYQPQVIGVISTKPGFILNSDAQTDREHPYVYPLALQGRVPVKVSSINGSIQPGDPLTSSPLPGIAMKATKGGQIIGKALENYANPDPNKVGKIMSFVNISYQIPQSSITKNGNLSLAPENTTLATADTQDNTPFFKKLSVAVLEATDTIVINGQPLSDYVETLVAKNVREYFAHLPSLSNVVPSEPTASNSAPLAKVPSTASSSAQATTQNPTATSASALKTLSASGSADLASESALLGSSSATQNAHASGSGALADAMQLLEETGSRTNTDFLPVASLSASFTAAPDIEADFAKFNQ
ncbi:MAG: hypothetical protein ACRD4B_05865, partial [Acidobacteriota bacterium]